MTFATADLYDEFGDDLQIVAPGFQNYGGSKTFAGIISTVKCHEDNSLVRAALEQDGSGKVLVVDGGESMRCALVGDMLAELGQKNGWQGIVVSGCIRDSAVIAGIDIGVKALNTNPRKSVKKNIGERDIEVYFSNARFTPGEYLYADIDGIVLSSVSLSKS